jgi:NADH dehydrogenase subunit 5 C-terminus
VIKIIKNLLIVKRVSIVKIILFIGSIINIPILSTYFFIPLLNLGLIVIKNLDQGWIEIIGGQGFIKKSINYIGGGDKLNYLNLKFYLSIFLFIIILVLLILYLNSLLEHSIEDTKEIF